QEIRELSAALHPAETLFVVDAMQGQDAVNVAKAFDDAIPLTGVVPTKLAGTSEKLGGLEPFHPERMAARILGMGDVLSLVEEAHKSIDLDEAKKLAEKVKKGKGFDLEDFKQQVAQMKKMGGLAGLVDKLPAQLAQAANPAQLDERQLHRIE